MATATAAATAAATATSTATAGGSSGDRTTAATMTVIIATSQQRRRRDDDTDSGRQRRWWPAEAEGRGSGPIWLLSIKLMRGPNNMLWEPIRNKITRKIMVFVLGGWKARGIPNGGFERVLARKAKKGEKFRSAGSTSLSTPPPSAHLRLFWRE